MKLGLKDHNKKHENKEVNLSIAYWITKSLGDDWKRAATLETLDTTLETNPTEILLAETKCESKLELNEMMVFQTSLSQKGEVVGIFKSNLAKKIKTLGENILWLTDRYDGALMHYITFNIPPSPMTKIPLKFA